MVERETLNRLAELLGLPYPDCENEERILIQMAAEHENLPIPDCENEERMLLRRYGIRT